MPKQHLIPVVRSTMLMTILSDNRGMHRYLGRFQNPGSVPPSREFSMLRRNPDWYDLLPEHKFTASLKFQELRHFNYVKTGAIWSCMQTQATYFMNDDNLNHLMNNSIVELGVVQGQWHIEKVRYAFTLVYDGAEESQ